MKTARWLALVLVLIALGGTRVFPVQAHAMLIRSIPDANAALASSPAQVELFFSEAIAPKLSKISVMDAGGKTVDGGDTRVDPKDAAHLLVSVQPLKDGVYTVVWSVISGTDGHQTTGAFPFAVGKVDAGAIAMNGTKMAPPAPPTPWADMILKGILYAAAAVMLGGMSFTNMVWNPSVRKAQVPPEDVGTFARISRGLMLAALVIIAVADMLSPMLQAGQASGKSVAWPWQPEFVALMGTRAGFLCILRCGLAAVLAGLLLPRPNGWNRWAGLGVSLVLLFTFSYESHAAGDANPLLAVSADWIHLIGVSVWVGGLFSFVGGMRLVRSLDPEPRTRMTSFLIPHFTVLAFTSVGLLVFTGLYASLRRVGTLDGLLNTPYGQALILKIILIAPMLALGGINFLFTSPSMRRAADRPGGSPTLVKRFSGLLVGEVILGTLVLIWVGVFTTLPPAQVASLPAGFNQTTRADDLSVRLTVDPAQPGMNTFTASLTSGGKPVADAQQVSLEFRSLSGMVPDSRATLANAGIGQYRLQGGYLSMPDHWDIKVVVIRPGKFDAYADFKLELKAPGGQAMP